MLTPYPSIGGQGLTPTPLYGPVSLLMVLSRIYPWPQEELCEIATGDTSLWQGLDMSYIMQTYDELTSRSYSADEAREVIGLAVKRLEERQGRNQAGDLIASRLLWDAVLTEAKCFAQFGCW